MSLATLEQVYGAVVLVLVPATRLRPDPISATQKKLEPAGLIRLVYYRGLKS